MSLEMFCWLTVTVVAKKLKNLQRYLKTTVSLFKPIAAKNITITSKSL